jgi:hypothetical protein
LLHLQLTTKSSAAPRATSGRHSIRELHTYRTIGALGKVVERVSVASDSMIPRALVPASEPLASYARSGADAAVPFQRSDGL